ncbi:alpha/beta hydrolase [Streptomyces violarus]|uniref:alpha/beta hydrolase n=1 Tax=Streptomyces violarus TaxID=67380 RepID=UPI0021C1BBCC|nr:alpha/beta hydrolase-fold protein [Streptomyces violarus]MCT9139774.1 alpha/beta hydrolase-fold protein [Streptomyces violarus]
MQLAGRIEKSTIDSALLRGNALEDPHVRPIWVYTPPGYEEQKERRYPAVYLLLGFTGLLDDWCISTAFCESIPQTVDRMMAVGECPPMVLIFVDAWTAYGGSQFVDSAGTGRYHSYLCEEVVPWVDSSYRTLPHRDHRAISGKSSGGFGAMYTAMLRPDLFGAIATHSGDALYETQYIPAFAEASRMLQGYGGDIGEWWAGFKQRVAFTRGEDMRLLEVLAVSACFSADDRGHPLLPFRTDTAELLPDVWERWLERDPVRMARTYADALCSQRAIWIDAGRFDQWNLDLGARAFRARLEDIGVAADRISFEIFDGGHFGIEYRQPLSLRWLAHRISLDPCGSYRTA